MKRSVLVLFALVAVFSAVRLMADDKEKKCCDGACAAAAESESAVEAKCPISGKKINKDAAVAYKGGKVYFCCPGCPAKFEADKVKYQTKANEQLVLTGQAKQKGCPLSGGACKADTALKIDGIEVTFCCNGCQGKVKKAAPEEQRELVFGKNFDKAFTVK